MADEIRQMGGFAVLVCGADGPVIDGEAAALDLIGGLCGQDTDWIAVPIARLGPDFLRLRSGLAGAVIQKFVTYQARLAIVGDIQAEVAASGALADFVRESNAGDRVWFVHDLDALAARLAR